MLFDKNMRRIQELERKLDAGKHEPDKIKSRIALLKSRGPEYWIRFWDKFGKPHDEKCPDDFQSFDGAKKYYKIVAGKSETSEHIMPGIRNTSVKEMVDFFLSHRKRKVDRTGRIGGYASAKTLCGYIAKMMGTLSFDECRENPQLLQEHIDSLYQKHSEWSQKYIWNYYKELKAVFSTWIKKKLLNVPNPMNAVDEPEQGIKVIDYVPTHEDYEKIIACGLVEGIRVDVLRLIGAVRYTGFRINEVLKLQIEDCDLNPKDGGLPFIWIRISKQKRLVRAPRPIRRELVEILREQIGKRVAGPVWPWKSPPYKLLRVYEWADYNGRNGYPARLKFKGWLYKLANVNVPRPFHDFRKTVKLELKRKMDPKRAQAYQGHKSESMDDYYTYFQREDLEIAVADSYRDLNRDQNNKGESFDSPLTA